MDQKGQDVRVLDYVSEEGVLEWEWADCYLGVIRIIGHDGTLLLDHIMDTALVDRTHGRCNGTAQHI